LAPAGDYPALRRGTLMLAQRPSALPSTFNCSGIFPLTMVAMLNRHISGIDRQYGRAMGIFTTAEHWNGDLAYGGKGEVLIARDTAMER